MFFACRTLVVIYTKPNDALVKYIGNLIKGIKHKYSVTIPNNAWPPLTILINNGKIEYIHFPISFNNRQWW